MRAYQQELFVQKTPYLQWLNEQETDLEQQYGQQRNQSALGKQIHTLPFSSCMDKMQDYGKFHADWLYLFVKGSGKLSEYAVAVFTDIFLKDSEVVFVYADEDYSGSLKELYGIEESAFGSDLTASYHFGAQGTESQGCACFRGSPWFKPDFSPDTLASFFYIGSVFAVRGSKILEMTEQYGNGLDLYELVYRIFMEALDRKMRGRREGIVHIPKVLYTNDRLTGIGRIDSSEKIRTWYRAERRVPSEGMNADCDKVSIVIPSKDHAKVLERCLDTLIKYTNYKCYEIIIVDNGSSFEEKMCITHVLEAKRKEKKNLVIQYLYQESAFNFSAMCNTGARAADGAYLLFLNDDIEVMDTEEGGDWLGRMMVYAAKTHVGAVGAKLYYPCALEENGCFRIQHAGITNMGIGPAHKLSGIVDHGCLYYGHNTQNYDMLAVTAACMLIRRSVFEAAGGFDETFPVAYNDVELCFRLYQRGYYNVQVNDAVLVHHESLSRGQDTSPEKQRRLAEEKQKLYEKYPSLIARDPFYNPNLVQWKKDTEYNTGYLYRFDRQTTPVLLEDRGNDKKRKQMLFKKYDMRQHLHMKYPLLAKLYDRLTGFDKILFQIDCVDGGDGIADDKITDNNLKIQGWCAVKNADNADRFRRLWLIYETRTFDFRSVYELEIAPKLREDVAALLEGEDRLKGTKNTALSGIHVNVDKSALKSGSYRIGVVCDNKLVCDLQKWVEIP